MEPPWALLSDDIALTLKSVKAMPFFSKSLVKNIREKLAMGNQEDCRHCGTNGIAGFGRRYVLKCIDSRTVCEEHRISV